MAVLGKKRKLGKPLKKKKKREGRRVHVQDEEGMETADVEYEEPSIERISRIIVCVCVRTQWNGCSDKFICSAVHKWHMVTGSEVRESAHAQTLWIPTHEAAIFFLVTRARDDMFGLSFGVPKKFQPVCIPHHVQECEDREKKTKWLNFTYKSTQLNQHLHRHTCI